MPPAEAQRSSYCRVYVFIFILLYMVMSGIPHPNLNSPLFSLQVYSLQLYITMQQLPVKAKQFLYEWRYKTSSILKPGGIQRKHSTKYIITTSIMALEQYGRKYWLHLIHRAKITLMRLVSDNPLLASFEVMLQSFAYIIGKAFIICT